MLSVHDLTRVYDDTTVLDGVSFDVRPGRMTGFVGANGAGKTTTMRIIVGVLAATRGSVTWDGSPVTVEQRRRIGYMPEERGLYPKMKVLDQLIFFGRLHGQSSATAADRARGLLGRLGLEERSGDVLEALSLGNQQRVQIAAALMHEPDALVMDEPFSGLDPLAVDSMVSLLRDEVSPEMPVLFSSHQLELVENLCDDLVILSHGKLVAAGAVADLRGREADRFRVVLGPGRRRGRAARPAPAHRPRRPRVRSARGAARRPTGEGARDHPVQRARRRVRPCRAPARPGLPGGSPMNSPTTPTGTPVWRIVAETEISTRVRDKTFIGATIFTLVFLVGFFVVLSIIGGNEDEYDVAITTSADAEVLDAAQSTLRATGSSWRRGHRRPRWTTSRPPRPWCSKATWTPRSSPSKVATSSSGTTGSIPPCAPR